MWKRKSEILKEKYAQQEEKENEFMKKMIDMPAIEPKGWGGIG